MNLGLTGKRVMVTGGTQGLGRATVLAFAQAGSRVLTCYHHDETAAKRLAADLDEIGGGHRVERADVASSADVTRLAQVCAAEFGSLDVLVNNVGVDAVGGLPALEPAEWDRVLHTNLTSMFLVCKAMLPLLGQGGAIVNVGSALALRGSPNRSHYSAAKAGMTGLTRSLCKELGPRDIRVNMITPGVIETEPGAGLPPELYERLTAQTALRRLATPQDVAAVALFLSSDLAHCVSGASIAVDGGV